MSTSGAPAKQTIFKLITRENAEGKTIELNSRPQVRELTSPQVSSPQFLNENIMIPPPRPSTPSSGISIEKRAINNQTGNQIPRSNSVPIDMTSKDSLIHIEKKKEVFCEKCPLCSFVETTVCMVCGETILTTEFIDHCLSRHMNEILMMVFTKNADSTIKQFAERLGYHSNAENNGENGSLSECSSDSDTEDEEYIAFIASTICTDGIQVNPIIPSVPITKPVTTNEIISQDGNQIIEEYSQYEIFLRHHKCIEITDSQCLCNICGNKFSNSIQLMQHAKSLHPIIETPQLTSALSFMRPKKPMSINEYMLDTKLRLDLVLYPPLKNVSVGPVVTIMRTPKFLFSLVFEALADENSNSQPCRYPKDMKTPCLCYLNVPASIPAMLEVHEAQFNVHIFNTKIASAKEIELIFGNILNSLYYVALKQFVFETVFSGEDYFGKLHRLSKPYNAVIMAQTSKEDIKGKSFTLVIWVYKPFWEIGSYQSFQKEIEELYNNNSIMRCKVCGEIYAKKSKCPNKESHNANQTLSSFSVCDIKANEVKPQ